MSFPRFLMRNISLKDKLFHFPLLSVNSSQVSNSPLKQFVMDFSGGDTPQSKISKQMIDMARSNPEDYKLKYCKSLQSIVDLTVSTYKDQAGTNTSKWGQQTLSTVLTAGIQGDGHGVMVATIEPHPDPENALRNYNQLRFLGAGFPARFASISLEQYVMLLSKGREIDGTPTDHIMNEFPTFLNRNKEQFQSGLPMNDYHLIGMNSIIEITNHFIHSTNGMIVQSGLFRTTSIHSQDGCVPWTMVYDPRIPNAIIHISLHFGQNNVPGGDFINAAIAPGLFKTLFHSGNKLSIFYEELVSKYGVDQASELTLNAQNEADFRKILDWKVNTDRAILSVAHATGGAVLNALHIFAPSEVCMMDTTKIEQVNSIDELNQLIEQGIELAKSEGYKGPGGLDSSDPNVTIPNTDCMMVGEAALTPDNNPYHANNPLDESMQPYINQCQALAKDIPWDYIAKAIQDYINNQVNDILDGNDTILNNTPEQWTVTIYTPDLLREVRQHLNKLVWEPIASDPSFNDISSTWGMTLVS